MNIEGKKLTDLQVKCSHTLKNNLNHSVTTLRFRFFLSSNNEVAYLHLNSWKFNITEENTIQISLILLTWFSTVKTLLHSKCFISGITIVETHKKHVSKGTLQLLVRKVQGSNSRLEPHKYCKSLGSLPTPPIYWTFSLNLQMPQLIYGCCWIERNMFLFRIYSIQRNVNM